MINNYNIKKVKEIYEAGRIFFKKEYKIADEKRLEYEKKESEEDRIYKQFQFFLEPEKGKYNPEVFGFFVNNKEELNKLIGVKDKSRMENLIKGSILEHLDPGIQELKITERKEQSRTYTTN